MNVVLVGYRGTGKSSVAALVGAALEREVVGLDAELVRRAGKPIPDVVAERGWTGFRDLEAELVRDYAARDGLVLDCGGGVIERPENGVELRRNGWVVWLEATPATIVARIGGDTQRPSLTGTQSFTDEVVEVLARRTPLYRALAHHVVATDERSIEAVAADVVAAVRREL